MVVQGAYHVLPGREAPIGGIATWSRGKANAQTSAVCLVHGYRCGRVISVAQAQRYSVDVAEDLQKWLMLAINGESMTVARQPLQPKPLGATRAV